MKSEMSDVEIELDRVTWAQILEGIGAVNRIVMSEGGRSFFLFSLSGNRIIFKVKERETKIMGDFVPDKNEKGKL